MLKALSETSVSTLISPRQRVARAFIPMGLVVRAVVLNVNKAWDFQ